MSEASTTDVRQAPGLLGKKPNLEQQPLGEKDINKPEISEAATAESFKSQILRPDPLDPLTTPQPKLPQTKNDRKENDISKELSDDVSLQDTVSIVQEFTQTPADQIKKEQYEDYMGYLWRVLTWENRLVTGVYFSVGLVAFYAVWMWFYVYEKNLCSLLCNIAMVALCINFVGGTLSSSWNRIYGNLEGSLTAEMISIIVSDVSTLSMQLYDKFFNSYSSWTTLNVLLVLWGMRCIGYYIGLYSLCFTTFMTLFAVPVILKEYKYAIKEQRGKMNQFVRSLKERMQLDRRHMLTLIAVILVLGWPFAAGETFATMAFAMMIVIKCQLRPDEIQKFEQKLTSAFTPLIQSVKKKMVNMVQSAQKEGILPTPQSTRVLSSKQPTFSGFLDMSEQKHIEQVMVPKKIEFLDTPVPTEIKKQA